MRVEYKDRVFLILFLDGRVVRVKERVLWAPKKPWASLTDYTRWSEANARDGRRPTRGIIFEVIQIAEKRYAGQTC